MMNTHRPFVYLAGPYSDSDADVREKRYHQHANAAAWLVQHGHVVYAPIVHCHPIAVAGGIQGGWTFWEHMDMPFLELSNMLIVLPMDGWLESKGLWYESRHAFGYKMPIAFMIGDYDSHQYLRITWSKELRHKLLHMTPPEDVDLHHA